MRRWPAFLLVLVAGASAIASCSDSENADPPALPEGAVDGGDAAEPPQDGSAADGAPQADAAPPNDANAPDATDATVRRVFLTSTGTAGDFGGLTSADEICRQAAVAAGLGGAWAAWLPVDGGSPATRLRADVVWHRIDGRRVATTAALVQSNLELSISVIEDGGRLDGAVGVWTGTNADAGLGETCAGWSTTDGGGTYGFSLANDTDWTQAGTRSCATTNHFYCFER